MREKTVICPHRVRRLPARYSWIDHRLVREGYIERVRAQSLALYLFLVTVADREGLSYYSESSISALLHIERQQLSVCRKELVQTGLIAYQKPLYQVLSLESKAAKPHRDPVAVNTAQRPKAEFESLGSVLRKALRKGEGQ